MTGVFECVECDCDRQTLQALPTLRATVALEVGLTLQSPNGSNLTPS